MIRLIFWVYIIVLAHEGFITVEQMKGYGDITISRGLENHIFWRKYLRKERMEYMGGPENHICWCSNLVRRKYLRGE